MQGGKQVGLSFARRCVNPPLSVAGTPRRGFASGGRIELDRLDKKKLPIGPPKE